MQPYYVLALFGELGKGPSKKFGVVGANDPLEAEEIVLKLAEEAKGRGEVASLAILQLYRNYPATLLDECSELRKNARSAESKIAELTMREMALKRIVEDLKGGETLRAKRRKKPRK